MAEPRISAVIPAYQAAATIAEALDSVFAQSPRPDEVIVVDDGSTDGTGEIVCARFPSVTLLTQENRGSAAAMNAGIARARGEMIALLDSDDVWTPRKSELQYAALAQDPTLDGIGGHVRSFLCPSVPAEAAAGYRIPEVPEPSLLTTALLVRHEAFVRVGDFSESLRIGYSIDWIHRAQRAGLRFAILSDVVLYRRVRPGSLSARSPVRDRAYLEMARRAINRTRDAGEVR